jgi:hypothetical protein
METVGRFKDFVRLGGFLFVILGVMCLPLGYGVSPKRDLSVFFNLADMGAFLRWAVGLIGFGGILLLVAFLLPGRFDE